MNFQYERSSVAPRVGENMDQKQDHHRLTREEIQSYVAQWLRQDLNKYVDDFCFFIYACAI